jgi:hypothetical protein
MGSMSYQQQLSRDEFVPMLLKLKSKHQLNAKQMNYIGDVLAADRINKQKSIDYHRQRLEVCLTLLEGKQWP